MVLWCYLSANTPFLLYEEQRNMVYNEQALRLMNILPNSSLISYTTEQGISNNTNQSFMASEYTRFVKEKKQ